jgi:hypothetical protein
MITTKYINFVDGPSFQYIQHHVDRFHYEHRYGLYTGESHRFQSIAIGGIKVRVFTVCNETI